MRQRGQGGAPGRGVLRDAAGRVLLAVLLAGGVTAGVETVLAAQLASPSPVASPSAVPGLSGSQRRQVAADLRRATSADLVVGAAAAVPPALVWLVAGGRRRRPSGRRGQDTVPGTPAARRAPSADSRPGQGARSATRSSAAL